MKQLFLVMLVGFSLHASEAVQQKSTKKSVSFSEQVEVIQPKADETEGAAEDRAPTVEFEKAHDGETSSEDEESDEQEDPFFSSGEVPPDAIVAQKMAHYSRQMPSACLEAIEHTKDGRDTGGGAQSKGLVLIITPSRAPTGPARRAPRIPSHLLLSSVAAQQGKIRTDQKSPNRLTLLS